MPPPIALFDACVLYPAPLRDMLMHLALVSLFRARWTQKIHDEWTENLLSNRPDLTRGQLARTCQLMNKAVPDSMVTGYESLIPQLDLPDPDDRHVLAAGIHAGAIAIVTFNLRDFPVSKLQPYNIQAIHPDDFVIHLAKSDTAKVCEAVKRNLDMLKHPPKTVDEYIDTVYRQGLPATAALLAKYKTILA
jgi:hypothetical protein